MANLPAGSTELPKDWLGSGFGVGTVIIIDPGGPNEERATVASVGDSIVLSAGTKFTHAPGTKITIVPPGAPATGTGMDVDSSYLHMQLLVAGLVVLVIGLGAAATRRWRS